MNGCAAMLAARFDLGDGVALDFPGDPTALGWIVALSYLIVAALCWRAAIRTFGSPRRKFFWLALALILIAFGLNKQLDLQTLLTLVGRRIADAQGWFEQRRLVQKIFVLALVTVGATTGLGLAALARPLTRRFLGALAGLVFLIATVALRAAEFEKVIESERLVRASRITAEAFQFAGLLCMTIAALMPEPTLRKPPDSAIGAHDDQSRR